MGHNDFYGPNLIFTQRWPWLMSMMHQSKNVNFYQWFLSVKEVNEAVKCWSYGNCANTGRGVTINTSPLPISINCFGCFNCRTQHGTKCCLIIVIYNHGPRPIICSTKHNDIWGWCNHHPHHHLSAFHQLRHIQLLIEARNETGNIWFLRVLNQDSWCHNCDKQYKTQRQLMPFLMRIILDFRREWLQIWSSKRKLQTKISH